MFRSWAERTQARAIAEKGVRLIEISNLARAQLSSRRRAGGRESRLLTGSVRLGPITQANRSEIDPQAAQHWATATVPRCAGPASGDEPRPLHRSSNREVAIMARYSPVLLVALAAV